MRQLNDVQFLGRYFEIFFAKSEYYSPINFGETLWRLMRSLRVSSMNVWLPIESVLFPVSKKAPMLILNPRVTRTAYPTELAGIMNLTHAHESRKWLSRWPLIAPHATPLYDMPDKAKQLNVARLSLKDESARSSLGSFKALGAPIALVRQILRLHPEFDPLGILAGRYRVELKDYTVISATDGNHGRGLAAAARDAGCRCVIILHALVSAEREQAIAALGAHIVRIVGNYDESVQEAARLASESGWQVVSDTSYEGYEEIPRDVMQGYGTIAEEIVEQTGCTTNEESPFTHVLLQGGVGGMAAGVASYLWEYHGLHRPRFIVVEPEQADCLLQSALEGRAAKATGSVDSVMAGLACGETSPLAWRFLEPCVDAFMTIEDDQAVKAMRWLALGSANDVPVVAGESAVAGLAALEVLRSDSKLSDKVRLNEQSRVLIISTEGATAPAAYTELVGESAESVLIRQIDWLSSHLETV